MCDSMGIITYPGFLESMKVTNIFWIHVVEYNVKQHNQKLKKSLVN
jgi:hypothetical protein